MAALESYSVTELPAEAGNTDWMAHGACKGKTHLFFPPRAERPQARVRREAQARLVCQACPVMMPCRNWARENREYGFWGGESEEERHLAGFTVAAPIGIRARTAATTPLPFPARAGR